MEFNGIIVDLSTIAGVALVTSLVTRFFVKQPLSKYKDKAYWYGIVVNFATLAIAGLFTWLGLLILGLPINQSTMASAVLRAFMGAVAAIGGYEAVNNAWIAIKKPEREEPKDGEA